MGPLRALALTTLFVPTLASAQEAVEIGVLKDTDMQVVQNVLFPKKGALEIGGHIGWLPFDSLITTPKAELSIDKHFTENLALTVMLGGGYGIKTAQYNELAGPRYGVEPYVLRYLGSALVGVSWAPIYGKFSANGRKVVHYDMHFTLRGGATLLQSVLGDATVTAAPTVAIGVGGRFFVREDLAVRAEVRDDLMVQYRSQTSSWEFAHHLGITLGVTWFSGKRSAR